MAEGQTSLGIARGSLLGCNPAVSQSAAAEIVPGAPWRRFLTRRARVEVPAQTAEINEVSPKKSTNRYLWICRLAKELTMKVTSQKSGALTLSIHVHTSA